MAGDVDDTQLSEARDESPRQVADSAPLVVLTAVAVVDQDEAAAAAHHGRDVGESVRHELVELLVAQEHAAALAHGADLFVGHA